MILTITSNEVSPAWSCGSLASSLAYTMCEARGLMKTYLFIAFLDRSRLSASSITLSEIKKYFLFTRILSSEG